MGFIIAMCISCQIHNLVSLFICCAHTGQHVIYPTSPKAGLGGCHCQGISLIAHKPLMLLARCIVYRVFILEDSQNPPTLCSLLPCSTLNPPGPKLATTRVNWASSCFSVTLLKARHRYSSACASLQERTSNRGPSVMTWVALWLLEIQTQLVGGLESARHSKKTSSPGLMVNTSPVRKPWPEFTSRLQGPSAWGQQQVSKT